MKARNLLIIVLLVLGATLIVMAPAGADGGCNPERWWDRNACPPPPTCQDWPGVGTPGYWKNHPEDWEVSWAPQGMVLNPFPVNCWPLDPQNPNDCQWDCCLVDQAQLIAWMDHPVEGNKVYTMLRALVAAKLNRFGCNPADCELPRPAGPKINMTMAKAALWMEQYGWVDGECGVLGTCEAWDECWDKGEPLYEALDAYNNGKLCAEIRDSMEINDWYE